VLARRSDSSFSRCSPGGSAFSSCRCKDRRITRAAAPSQDSPVCTMVLPSRGSSRYTWTALIPTVLPVQARTRGGVTCRKVEVIVPGPTFHRNVVPRQGARQATPS
jgi:hypothetical protein